MTSFTRYILGYVLSAIFTVASASLAYAHLASDHALLSHAWLMTLFVLFALLQFFVQCVFFLHLGAEKRASPTLVTFSLTLVFVGILVGGTLWIMANVNHAHQTTHEFLHDTPSPQNQLN